MSHHIFCVQVDLSGVVVVDGAVESTALSEEPGGGNLAGRVLVP